MKTFILDGADFSDWNGFTKALYNQFNQDWYPFGLNWLDDILYGDVVGFDENEPVVLVWKNNQKSRADLNRETESHLSSDAIREYGGLYECILDLIRSHENITLRLETEEG